MTIRKATTLEHSTTLTAPPKRQAFRGYWPKKVFAVAGPLPLLLLALIVVFAIGNPVFLSPQNLQSIATQAVFLLLIALAQMLILISGGFDLSVGSNVALTSICSALVMRAVYGGIEEYAGISIFWGFVVSILVGLVVGLVNGIGVAVLRVNAFIVTLATMSIFEGITMVISGGAEVSGLPRLFTHGIGSDRWLGIIPVALILALPAVLAIFVVLRWTRYGKSVYAIGSNELAATVAGIRVKRNLLLAYVIGGVLTSFAGWLLTARVSSGQPALGSEYVMESITAAIIGGAVLTGGRGTVGGTILGVLFIIGLTNGMNLIRLDSNQQNIAIGIALVLSILITRARERTRAAVAVAELEMKRATA